ncbi:Hypothetical protein SRAE_X000083500 [Strongyloides ratti]|uniref:Uncharacterized protein n=1 Tax=Strongyloides ratti TaxID=34506 RepID=A0A090LP24_STRRB|nr:Hypothetical protein SRAE_X000083500 [Strongyloides ratti]CEF71511.1 Hypothetical protein SRAE_X000083500 [Strongyloides ratti]
MPENPSIRYAFESVECNGSCYHGYELDPLERLGCTTDKLKNITSYINFTTPACYKNSAVHFTLCICDWDNCNILEGQSLFESILKARNSISQNKANILMSIIFIIFLVTL